MPRRMKTAGFLKAEDQTFILLLKDIIIDCIFEIVRIDIVSRTDSWNTDRMRSNTEFCFQMFCMH